MNAHDLKILVGKELAGRVTDGQTIGVGTGSTVACALEAINERVRNEGLRVRVVPTSYQSAWQCERAGLDVLYPGYCGELDWGFDGADALDASLRAVKGGGAALLQEKILAARCAQYVVIVDASKLCSTLAGAFPVPVEFVPTALSYVEAQLKELGAKEMAVRFATSDQGKANLVYTECGNLLLDVQFDSIPDDLEARIQTITGVVDSGLFLTQATEALIAENGAVRSLTR